jgi:hypothetical protein
MTIAFDQGNSVSVTAATGTGDFGPSTPTTAGDFVIIGLSAYGSVLSPTLTAPGSPVLLNSQVNGDCNAFLWYIPNCPAVNSSNLSIAFGGTVQTASALVAGYSGLQTSSPIDGSSVIATFNSTTCTGGSYTPGSSGDLLLGVMYQATFGSKLSPSSGPTYSGPSSGWNLRLSNGEADTAPDPRVWSGIALLDILGGGSGSVTPSVTSSLSGTGVGITLGVKAVGAGGSSHLLWPVLIARGIPQKIF